MSKSDFFSFIISLKPIELKAIGSLSQTLHLEEGVTVYKTGDVSDGFYIINRGALEVIHDSQGQQAHTPVSYLSRGDLFGETETLSDIPRKNSVRTCESASIQQFQKKDFPELVRRVPQFFYYLSQQLATQMTKITDTAFVQSNCLELSGNLANFDLVTVYQTILNSSQTGELSIVNENKETSSVFFFEEGQARYGQYYHLQGEEAFWQLFLHEKLSGTFSFSIVKPGQGKRLGPMIDRNPTDLLITALQYRDEFKGVCEFLPPTSALLRRERLNLEWTEPEDGHLRDVAEAIWQRCYSSELTLEELSLELPVCEMKFFKAVIQLVDTGHFSLVETAQDVAV